MKEKLHTLISLLLAFQPDPNWWPGSSSFEIAVSAVLTQNTSWNNVSKAMERLAKSGINNWEQILKARDLETIINPAGFYRRKATTLRELAMLMQKDPIPSREELLNVKGIGPETADSILLYALGKPEMVVDSYTYRVLRNCGLVNGPFNYEQIKQLLITTLGQDSTNVDILKRLHAAFVEVAKNYCKKKPHCVECPLNKKEGLPKESPPFNC